MEPVKLIEKINNASKIEDVLSIVNFKQEFNAILKEIHPDVCSLNGSSEATLKMNEWKSIIENGRVFKDDCGSFKTNGYWVEFESEEKNVKWSLENYNILMKLNSDSDKHFQKYIPSSGVDLGSGKIRFNFDKRAIPLSGLDLSQEHVNWVLNRIFEYCTYLEQIGMVHCGINPESIFIVPETHGIQVCSFYHLTKIGNKVGTVSGKYYNWYPSQLLKTKIASSSIDIELAKKTAIYLLGDKSGSGIKLRKTHNSNFIDFLIKQDNKFSYDVMSEYKQLLKDNFKSEFHLLTI